MLEFAAQTRPAPKSLLVPTELTKTWKPSKRQADFLSIPDSVFEALYGGAAGGGKSDALVLLPIVKELHQHSRFKGIIFRRTYPELEAEIILRSREWYQHTGATYNEEKKRWTWPSGAIMQFGHCEKEQDVRKYDSAEYQYVGWDELTSFTKFQYSYITYSRMRSTSGLPIIARSATNPGNVGHAWVRDYFVAPAPPNTIIVDKVTKNKRIFIPAKATDNPHVDAGYITRLQMLPEAERLAKLEGDWWTFEGQVFSDFRFARLESEPEHAFHVIDPFEIPTWWPRILAGDWGYQAMTFFLWGAIAPNKRLYVYREYGVKETLVSTWATEVGRLSEGEEIADCILCQSTFAQRGNEELTTAQKFEKFSGIRPRSSENTPGSRIIGKLLIQEYLRWREKPRKPPELQGIPDVETARRILRVHGQRAYEDYLLSFREEPIEDNLPKLRFFASCPKIIETIPLCVYDDKDKMSGKPAEDVKEFIGDDPYDTLNYLCRAADKFTRSNIVEGNRLAAIEKIQSSLARTGNQTAFYRQMEKLERNQRSKRARPVRRFHRVA